jgi:outer membrane protein OmpA-like peptidoglycan-associated protein
MKLLTLAFILCAATQVFSQTRTDTAYVYFDSDRFEIRPENTVEFERLLDRIDTAEAELQLRGHCDSRGSDAYNERLSRNRVQAVRRLLLSYGWLEREIVLAEGLGERQPIRENETEEGRAKNRRVEVIAVWKEQVTDLKTQLTDPTITAGSNIILKNIHFVGGRALFLEESYPILNELLEVMQSVPTLKIRVEGHICCHVGNDDGIDLATGIQNLSEARARAVRDFLVKSGISGTRVGYMGFGHSRPLYPYPEVNDEQRTANRRVEIKILEK